MTGIGDVTAALIGVALATLIACAVWALYLGLRAQRGAASAIAANARLEALVGSAPVLAMLVRADRRLELPDRLADWFGLSLALGYLADLSSGATGLTPADPAALAEDVAAA